MSALNIECGSGLIKLATRDALAITSECGAILPWNYEKKFDADYYWNNFVN